jgi:hypothetical protein
VSACCICDDIDEDVYCKECEEALEYSRTHGLVVQVSVRDISKPHGQRAIADISFSHEIWERLGGRTTGDMATELGNLVERTVVDWMIEEAK